MAKGKSDVERLLDLWRAVPEEKAALVGSLSKQRLEHLSGRFKEKSLDEEYFGSAVRRVKKDKDGKEKEEWRKEGLSHVFSEIYSENYEIVTKGIEEGKEDVAISGLEHFILSAAESLRDHTEVQAAVKTHKGYADLGLHDGEEGFEEKMKSLKSIAKQLYIGDEEIQGYIRAASAKDKNAFGNFMRGIRDNLPKQIVERHIDYVKKEIERNGIENPLRAAIYEQLHPKDKTTDVKVLSKLPHEVLGAKYHQRKQIESYEKSNKEELKTTAANDDLYDRAA